MNRTIRSAKFCLLGLLALALLPLGALADQLKTEVVSIQINITSPRGMTIIGTVVARRTLGPVITTDLSFNGMVNGSPVSGTATATEQWLGTGSEDIQINTIRGWKGAIAAPQPMSLHIAQDAPDLFTANGVPFAIDGLIQPPGSGRPSYIVTMPGQGSKPISQLPNMGLGPDAPAAASGDAANTVDMVTLPSTLGGFQSLFLVALLVSASLALGGLRLVLRRRDRANAKDGSLGSPRGARNAE